MDAPASPPVPARELVELCASCERHQVTLRQVLGTKPNRLIARRRAAVIVDLMAAGWNNVNLGRYFAVSPRQLQRLRASYRARAYSG